MARMANAVSPLRVAKAASEFDCHLSLVPKDQQDGGGRWSIDAEAMGETWHDSSWMLSKGLDVIERFELEPLPTTWTQLWKDATVAESGFPNLRLSELG